MIVELNTPSYTQNTLFIKITSIKRTLNNITEQFISLIKTTLFPFVIALLCNNNICYSSPWVSASSVSCTGLHNPSFFLSFSGKIFGQTDLFSDWHDDSWHSFETGIALDISEFSNGCGSSTICCLRAERNIFFILTYNVNSFQFLFSTSYSVLLKLGISLFSFTTLLTTTLSRLLLSTSDLLLMSSLSFTFWLLMTSLPKASSSRNPSTISDIEGILSLIFR